MPLISSVKSPASEIVEPLIVISSTVSVVRVPTLVILACAAVDKVPARVLPVTVPVVVIAEEPTSILPNPDVIDPAFKAPTLVICVCEASTDNECAIPSPEVAPVDVIPVPPVIVLT